VRFPQELALKTKAKKFNGINCKMLFFKVCSGVRMYTLGLFHIETVFSRDKYS
jgi:hypothetical protein